MFITKMDRARMKMREDFKHVKIDPSDFSNLMTKDQFEARFNEFAEQERQRLEDLGSDSLAFDSVQKDAVSIDPVSLADLNTNSKITRMRTMANSIDRFHSPKTHKAFDLCVSGSFTKKNQGDRDGSSPPMSPTFGSMPSKLMHLMMDSDLLKEFGVDSQFLTSIRGSHEKIKYVLTEMKRQIGKDLIEFNETLAKQQEEHFIKEEEYKVLKKRNESKNSETDIFEWMKLPTKFNLLKKRLRQKMVETIGDGENYQKLKQALDEMDNCQQKSARVLGQSKGSNPYIFGSDSTAVGITTTTDAGEIDRKVVLDNVKFDNQAILEEATQFMKSTKIGSKNRAKTSHSEKMSGRVTPKQVEKYGPADIESLIEKASQLPSRIEWTKEKDKMFNDKRKQARHQLVYLCNSSSWNEVGFSKFINEIRYNDTNKNFRDEMIQRYMGGELLNEAEIRYIAVTSESLNRFLDQK